MSIEIKKCTSKDGKTIEGLYEIQPKVFGDSRGFFLETYSKRDFKTIGIDVDFVQDNESSSVKGVLRGLHYQKKYPQGKLVRVIQGKVFDVAVDIRKDSQTYSKWYGLTLSEDLHNQFYIPKGFAHGFLVLSDTAVFSYKCTEFYHPEDESGIIFDDPSIRIDWPNICRSFIMSQKDKLWKPLQI